MTIITFLPHFDTMGKPCLSTFRITFSFFNNRRMRCIYEMISEGTSKFSVPFFCADHNELTILALCISVQTFQSSFSHFPPVVDNCSDAVGSMALLLLFFA